MLRLIHAASLMLVSGFMAAQYNAKGRFHLAIGGAIGAHGTQLDQKFKILGITVSNTENDAAATTSLPIELGVGLGNRFSIGLLLEPGRYVPDSAATEQKNAVAIVAVQPRFFLINKDRFAWTASLQVGAAALRIQDDTQGAKVDERYNGPAFGLGSGIAFGLGESVGLEFHLRYLATRMELRAREFNDFSTMDFYNATLTTGGVVAQISLAFRIGGK